METQSVNIPRPKAVMDFKIWFMVAEPASMRHDEMRLNMIWSLRRQLVFNGERRPYAG